MTPSGFTSATNGLTCNVGATNPEDYGDYFVWGEMSLELSDDAAKANWGGSWRMPTRAELKELIYECDWTWKAVVEAKKDDGSWRYTAKEILEKDFGIEL